MSGMGPPPKANAQRRGGHPTAAMMKLPVEGRQGDAPEWPLATFESSFGPIWADLWHTPQAAAWERLGIGTVRTVARYVMILALAEDPSTDATASARAAAEARQLEDRLGLSPLAMLRLRWEIAPDELAEARSNKTSASTRRLKVVDSVVAAL